MSDSNEAAARGLPVQAIVAIAVAVAVLIWLVVLSKWGPFAAHSNDQQIRQILDQIAGEV